MDFITIFSNILITRILLILALSSLQELPLLLYSCTHAYNVKMEHKKKHHIYLSFSANYPPLSCPPPTGALSLSRGPLSTLTSYTYLFLNAYFFNFEQNYAVFALLCQDFFFNKMISSSTNYFSIFFYDWVNFTCPNDFDACKIENSWAEGWLSG